jgi:hypothetical protein
MNNIIESRNFIFEDKIISLNDIRLLADILIKEYDKLPDKRRNDVTFWVDYADGSSFRGSSNDFFDERQLNHIKKIENIRMKAHLFESGSEISIGLLYIMDPT